MILPLIRKFICLCCDVVATTCNIWFDDFLDLTIDEGYTKEITDPATGTGTDFYDRYPCWETSLLPSTATGGMNFYAGDYECNFITGFNYTGFSRAPFGNVSPTNPYLTRSITTPTLDGMVLYVETSWTGRFPTPGPNTPTGGTTPYPAGIFIRDNIGMIWLIATPRNWLEPTNGLAWDVRVITRLGTEPARVFQGGIAEPNSSDGQHFLRIEVHDTSDGAGLFDILFYADHALIWRSCSVILDFGSTIEYGFDAYGYTTFDYLCVGSDYLTREHHWEDTPNGYRWLWPDYPIMNYDPTVSDTTGTGEVCALGSGMRHSLYRDPDTGSWYAYWMKYRPLVENSPSDGIVYAFGPLYGGIYQNWMEVTPTGTGYEFTLIFRYGDPRSLPGGGPNTPNIFSWTIMGIGAVYRYTHFGAYPAGNLTLTRDASVSVCMADLPTLTIEPVGCVGGDTAPPTLVCDPPLRSETGTLRFHGTIGDEVVVFCMTGPLEGPWTGVVNEFSTNLPVECADTSLTVTLKCNNTTTGTADDEGWVVEFTDMSTGEIVTLPFDITPGAEVVSGMVSGTLDTICMSGTGSASLAVVGNIADIGDGASMANHPFVRCCGVDPVNMLCSYNPDVLYVQSTIFDPGNNCVFCPGDNCSEGDPSTLSLTQGPVTCNGNPITPTNFDPDMPYYRGLLNANNVAGEDFVQIIIYCDGTSLRYAIFPPNDDPTCAILGEGTFGSNPNFPYWDCASLSGHIGWDFTDNCANAAAYLFLIT